MGRNFKNWFLILLICLLSKIRNFTCIFAPLFGSEEGYAYYMNFRPHSMEPIPLLVFRAARNPRFPSLLRVQSFPPGSFSALFFPGSENSGDGEAAAAHSARGRAAIFGRALPPPPHEKKRSRNVAICVFLFSRPFHPVLEKCNLQEI